MTIFQRSYWVWHGLRIVGALVVGAGLFFCGWECLPALLKPALGNAAALRDVKNQTSAADVVRNYEKHIQPLLREKCLQCHTSTVERPFFYVLPMVSLVLKPYVDQTIRKGRAKFDFSNGFPEKRLGGAMEFLLRVGGVGHDGSLPPLSYRLARPWTAPSEEERKIMFLWAETGSAVLRAVNPPGPRVVRRKTG